ncbi:DUF317 domain-containing protein [Streptomyces sp. NPDC056930]|uniref:DUF317 domain-containing protein n=1 Tax=Streptomyces sp. NPDC056930 TaxID=3345967 RepID=UPI00362766AD
MEAPPYPEFPIDPSTPDKAQPVYRVGPRHLAADDGRLYDAVADTLAGLAWTSLTIVRRRHEPDEAPEDRQVLRSTVLHISPDTLRRAQWVLADEPFHLGELPIAWQVSARADTSSPLAMWSAYFIPDVPGEVLVDFLVALDARWNPPRFGFSVHRPRGGYGAKGCRVHTPQCPAVRGGRGPQRRVSGTSVDNVAVAAFGRYRELGQPPGGPGCLHQCVEGCST